MTLAEQIELACLMEVTARKPGNVHPAASFVDLCYEDFVQAAKAIAEPLSATRNVGLGRAIFDAVNATRLTTEKNVNLGIVLLLAPLAAVSDDIPLEIGIGKILEQTTTDDADQVYAAIRLAQPGGMGQTTSQDIRSRPTVTLREAMALAANRDRIAQQYVTDFSLVFEAKAKLCEQLKSGGDWEAAIIALHVWMMSKWPDTLIARKCGPETAERAAALATSLGDHSAANGAIDPIELGRFDSWLRSDGHRRNPGTTADLIAATLFAALRDGSIATPSREEIQLVAAGILAESQQNRRDFSTQNVSQSDQPTAPRIMECH